MKNFRKFVENDLSSSSSSDPESTPKLSRSEAVNNFYSSNISTFVKRRDNSIGQLKQFETLNSGGCTVATQAFRNTNLSSLDCVSFSRSFTLL